MKKPFDPKDFSTYGLGVKEGKDPKEDKVPKYHGGKKYTPDGKLLDSGVSVMALPTSVDLRPNFGPIRNQGAFGTCVAFATAALREYYESKYGNAGSNPTQLSPLYIYYPNYPDEGMYVGDGLDNIKNRGVCPETERPYHNHRDYESQFYEPLTTDQQNAAAGWDIANRVSISSSGSTLIDDIKTRIAAGDPVILSIYIYSNFDNPGPGGVIGPVPQGESSRGGHAVVAVGYDDVNQWFIVRNSWGTSWGDNGYGYIPYNVYLSMRHSNPCYADITGYTNHPPQNVRLNLSSIGSNSVTLSVSAIGASNYDLYRDGVFVKNFTGTTVVDNCPVGPHNWFVRAKKAYGATRSNSIGAHVGGGSGMGTSFADALSIPNASTLFNEIAVANQSVYFKFIAPATDTYTFETDSDMDLKMDLYSNAQSLIKTDDDTGMGNNPQIQAQLTVGQTYYLRVYPFNSFYTGWFSLKAYGATPVTITEDFEDGTFNIPFTGDWIRTTASKYAGSYAYTNKDISHSQVSQTSFKVTAPSGGTLSFYYSTSSEKNYDFLKVLAGTTEILSASGTTGWTQFTYNLPKGTTEITFKYQKDGSVDSGADSVYIDNVAVSGSGVTVSPGSSGGSAPGACSLSVGSPTNNSLTLNYSASGATSYDIYRNGQLIVSGRTSTSYTDTGLLPGTTYSYFVVARNSYDSSTSPTVQGTTTGGGVTPITILEDFSDQNYNFNFTGTFTYDSTNKCIYIYAYNKTVQMEFTVDVPVGATVRQLNYDYKGDIIMGGSPQLEVYVNGVLKATHTETDEVWRSASTITLGTGQQTITFKVVTPTAAYMAYLDNIKVNWA